MLLVVFIIYTQYCRICRSECSVNALFSPAGVRTEKLYDHLALGNHEGVPG